MSRKVVGFVGFMSAGKSTAANFLVEDQGYKSVAFAGALKDAVAAIFSWPRELLEGDTLESREFRETVDPVWQSRIGDLPMLKGRPVTPRLILQLMGTDILRNHFHTDIWVLSVMKKIESDTTNSFVITDARFKNEIALVRSIGGKIVRIRREREPIWFDVAKYNPEDMPTLYPNVHASEWNWVSMEPDFTVENDGTLEDLRARINRLEL
jgi:hypothetical protein